MHTKLKLYVIKFKNEKNEELQEGFCTTDVETLVKFFVEEKKGEINVLQFVDDVTLVLDSKKLN